MRGKLTVIVMLVGSALFAGYAYWYFFTTSPADTRFNLTRRSVPENSVLVGRQVGDYRLNGEPGGDSGTYIDDAGTEVKFSVTRVPDHAQAVAALNTPITGCDKLVAHTDATIPYVYAGCPNAYTFAWVNGNYRFQAQSSDPVLLVFFVNAYPY